MTRADQRSYHFIYKTTCIETSKYYIGLHSTNNIDDGYLGSGLRFRRSIAKYGVDKHKREILEMCKDRMTLKQREKEIVCPELLKDPLCMNLIVGGQEGHVAAHNEETKRKISEANKGRVLRPRGPWSQKRRQKHEAGGGWKGRPGHPQSIETRLKLREINLGERNHRYGTKHTDETKAKMKASQMGEKNHAFGKHWKLSDRTREKMSGAAKLREAKKKVSGYSITEETRAKLSKFQRERYELNANKVVCYGCGIEFRLKPSAAVRRERHFHNRECWSSFRHKQSDA